MTDLPIACRGVFFDLYGTLLRYGAMERAWQDWLEAMHAGLAACGHDLHVDRLEATFAGFLNTPQPPLSTLGRTLFERRVTRELGTLGVRLTATELAALCDTCVGRWQDHVTLDAQAHDVLATLRQELPVALVSNFDHEIHVHRVLRETRLAEHFTTVVVSSEVGFAKPDPRIFDAALERTGLAARDVVYIGDADIDREAAHGAGMRFIRVDGAGAGTHAEPSVRALSELPARLRPMADRA